MFGWFGKGKPEDDGSAHNHGRQAASRPPPGQLTVFIYQSDFDFISKLVLSNKNRETGGDLYGAWRHTGSALVQVVSEPGPEAALNILDFTQDEAYTAACAQAIFRRTGLEHMGTWHSHHQLHLPHPSGGDDHTFIEGIKRNKVPRVLCAIANIVSGRLQLNFFMYLLQPDEHEKVKRVPCLLEILPGPNPLEIDLSPEAVKKAAAPAASAAVSVPVTTQWYSELAFRQIMGGLYKSMPPSSAEYDNGSEEMRLVYKKLGVLAFKIDYRTNWTIRGCCQDEMPNSAWEAQLRQLVTQLLAAQPLETTPALVATSAPTSAPALAPSSVAPATAGSSSSTSGCQATSTAAVTAADPAASPSREANVEEASKEDEEEVLTPPAAGPAQASRGKGAKGGKGKGKKR